MIIILQLIALKQERKTELHFQVMQCRLKRISDLLLYSSVGIATLIFTITLVAWIIGDKDYNARMKMCISVELMWALIDTVVCLSLVGIGFFAVYKLS